MKSEKIIFLSTKNPFSKEDWSGIPFFLFQALSNVYDVEYVSIPDFKWVRSLGYYLSSVYFFFTKRKYVFDYGVVMALLYGISGSFLLRKKEGVKFVFSPAGLTEIAFLNTDIPIICYGDCSTLQLFDYYPALYKVSRISKREIQFIENNAFKRVVLAAFSSSWASDFVKRKFSKSCVTIPFGSNIINPSPSIAKKLGYQDECNLLFIGVDWIRKGGDVALRIHQDLLRKGLPSRLTIVGSSIPDGTPKPEYVCLIPRIDKNTQDGEAILSELFSQANFFLLPTLADCTPIVIAEAYSLGLPVLATNTGGISSMVIDSLTGYLFNEGDVDGYVDKIEYLIRNEPIYTKMSSNCLEFHSNTLNWSTWATNLRKTVSTCI